ncbi:GAF domain-containing protein [Congregibacter variabilis]|uniref:GAF domain-containing protein n=1 Tax=Congregibacter variabilis TaxID=3081200 RepID=A0ABZ0I0M0_9GAMM|nr:GAF domain-containing protein [Congregibacter sp. IMCC43200]
MNDAATIDAAVSTLPRLSLTEACQQLTGLLGGERDLIANAANTSAFLNTLLPDINWIGFYVLQGDELVLGPFQGEPACVRIPVGRGVCGTCVASGDTQRVDDVHAFPGHIACDVRSRSELVVPVRAQGTVVAVLDIDSPSVARFSVDDQNYVEVLVDEFSKHQFSQG